MLELFTVANFMTLCMLTLLQIVLGFDNLLYISIESKRVSANRQAFVRRMGIGLAIALRIILLLGVTRAISAFENPFFSINLPKIVEGQFNLHACIVLAGGVFIIYTATKEIHHMLVAKFIEGHDEAGSRSVGTAIFWVVMMNLVFSFDSILSAMALTRVFVVMATAIVISGILMIWLADHVAEFLDKNRIYEVLGLFILLIVGIMLLSEGGHLAHLRLFNYEVEPMAKTTFYFVIVVLVLVDLVQGRYQKNLQAQHRG